MKPNSRKDPSRRRSVASTITFMDDPAAIGPAMAVALLTTLYGAVIANLVCLPIADKLSTKGKIEDLNSTLTIDGIMIGKPQDCSGTGPSDPLRYYQRSLSLTAHILHRRLVRETSKKGGGGFPLPPPVWARLWLSSTADVVRGTFLSHLT